MQFFFSIIFFIFPMFIIVDYPSSHISLDDIQVFNPYSLDSKSPHNLYQQQNLMLTYIQNVFVVCVAIIVFFITCEFLITHASITFLVPMKFLYTKNY